MCLPLCRWWPSPSLHCPACPRPCPCETAKWDYYYNPPRVSGTGETGWPSNARQAFDGYPSRLDQPYLRNCWRSAVTPTSPAQVTINYRRPVAVTRYVHYFVEPAAWKSVEILASVDGEIWQPLQRFDDLPHEYPQFLPIDKPVLARFYKIVVHSLAGEAGTSLVTHEVETNYGPTVGAVAMPQGPVIQGEPITLSVRLLNADARTENTKLHLKAPLNSLEGTLDAPVSRATEGDSVAATFHLTPLRTGPTPIEIEWSLGDGLIDSRTFTLNVAPKLAFKDVFPQGGDHCPRR